MIGASERLIETPIGGAVSVEGDSAASAAALSASRPLDRLSGFLRHGLAGGCQATGLLPHTVSLSTKAVRGRVEFQPLEPSGRSVQLLGNRPQLFDPVVGNRLASHRFVELLENRPLEYIDTDPSAQLLDLLLGRSVQQQDVRLNGLLS